MEHGYDKIRQPDLEELVRKLDRQLEALRVKPPASKPAIPKPFSSRRIVLQIMMLAIGIAAPFVVLIRTSVFLHSAYQLNAWLALSAGILATILLLTAYGLYARARFGFGRKFRNYLLRGAVILVIAYTLYGLFYYSGMNTKTREIRSYYRSLHPIMRVALTTITLADSDLLVTDIKRRPDDYLRMGLPENPQSLHYVQRSGYVHAVDIRTAGRAEWKNLLTRSTFELIGLQAIRHVGTADHLHVYIPLNN